MELTERKKKVLRSIVDLYIRTAEPVGSKAIRKWLTTLPQRAFTASLSLLVPSRSLISASHFLYL